MATISVIVPVYNVEPYLNRCIDSILTQSFADFELILVDDGSPDNCPAICDGYAKTDNRIHVIHQKNGGLSAARNAGLDRAFANSNSEWITFIDSDDWVHRDYLKLLYDACVECDAKISVCGSYGTDSIVVPDDDYLGKAEKWTVEQFWLEKLLNATVSCLKLYHKSFFESIRFPVGKLHEDEATTYKILFTQNEIAVVPYPLYYYFHNPNSICNSEWTEKKFDLLLTLEEQIDFFDKNGYRSCAKRGVYSYVDASEKYYDLYLKRMNCSKKEIDAFQKKCNNFIKKYKRLGMNIRRFSRFYELTYPKRSYLYWQFEGIKSKFFSKRKDNCQSGL